MVKVESVTQKGTNNKVVVVYAKDEPIYISGIVANKKVLENVVCIGIAEYNMILTKEEFTQVMCQGLKWFDNPVNTVNNTNYRNKKTINEKTRKLLPESNSKTLNLLREKVDKVTNSIKRGQITLDNMHKYNITRMKKVHNLVETQNRYELDVKNRLEKMKKRITELSEEIEKEINNER